MTSLAQFFSNPIVAVAARMALGGCVIYMARVLYVDPVAYFRSSTRSVPDSPGMRLALRCLACFCLWGGCFILATVIAVQILDLHSNALGPGLVTFSAIAAWLLLPRLSGAKAEENSGTENTRKPK